MRPDTDLEQDFEEYPFLVTVEVTEDDIKRGERKNPDHCPIALAVARQFPGEYKGPFSLQRLDRAGGGRVSVSPRTAYVDYYRAYDLPQEATDFVHRFDQCLFVKPETFILTRRT